LDAAKSIARKRAPTKGGRSTALRSVQQEQQHRAQGALLQGRALL